MSGAHADPAELRQFAKKLRSTSDQVSGTVKDVRRTLSGLDWNDTVKQSIDRDVAALTKQIERLAKQLDEHAKTVERKAGELQSYLGKR